MIKAFGGSHSVYSEISELAKKCSQLNLEFEKVAMIRIAELEDRISHLKDLISVADERITQIIELQNELEKTALSLKSSPAVQPFNDPDLITRFRLNMKPDLSNLEIRLVQKLREECSKIYDELSSKIEAVKIKNEPAPRPQKETHPVSPITRTPVSAIAPPPAGAEITASTHQGKIKQNGYILPRQHLEPAVINDKYFEVYKLAEQGLDAAAISEITRMEKRAINFILSLRNIQ